MRRLLQADSLHCRMKCHTPKKKHCQVLWLHSMSDRHSTPGAERHVTTVTRRPCSGTVVFNRNTMAALRARTSRVLALHNTNIPLHIPL